MTQNFTKTDRENVAKLLIENGADVNARNHDGVLLIHEAVGYGSSFWFKGMFCISRDKHRNIKKN